MSQLQIKTDKINAEIAVLQEQLQAATAQEVLVVGNEYSIHVGKGDTAKVIVATLLGQRSKENGAAEFRFSAGEGFDARFYDVSYNRVVLDLPEGTVTSGVIAKNIARLETKRDNLAANLAAQAERENLVDGETYEIKVGKGETAGVVRAVLLGQAEDEDGAKVFKFFYGAGFAAEIVKVGIKRVVFAATADEEQEEEEQDVLEQEQE